MATTISCFVNINNEVFLDRRGENDPCIEYKFNLDRRIFVSVTPDTVLSWMQHLWMYDSSAGDFFYQHVGTPEKLVEFVKTVQLNKASLVALLKPEKRQEFLNACAVIEKEATDKCGASGEPCLEDGCAFEGTDETCLNAILLSEGKCLKACTDVWVGMFENPKNRIEVWKS